MMHSGFKELFAEIKFIYIHEYSQILLKKSLWIQLFTLNRNKIICFLFEENL